MKYISRFTALLLSLALFTGCASQAVPDPQVTSFQPDYPAMAPYPDESQFVNLATGEFDSDGFSLVYDAWLQNRDLKAEIPEGYADSLDAYFLKSIPALLDSGEQNAAASPLNIYMALAMLAEITGSDSRQEILDLLQAESAEALRTQANQVWKAHYCADGASSCVLANSLWLDTQLPFHEDTVSRLNQDYYASVFHCDLGTEAANHALRQWLDEQTSGLLTDQTQNLSMDPQTALALASTIYYRAKWSSEFNPGRSSDEIFHAPSGDRTATFMNKELTYGPYYWGDDYGAVSLRLEDGSKMWLILPDEGKTPADILSSGHALRLVLGGWLETGAQKSLRVNLSLPKFDVVSNISLNESLKELGICSVFDQLSADFSPITTAENLWLDRADHAARVKIDEEGVEAAAYTVMMAAGASMPPEDEIDFVLDRPFLFVITSGDELPLFAGIVNEP